MGLEAGVSLAWAFAPSTTVGPFESAQGPGVVRGPGGIVGRGPHPWVGAERCGASPASGGGAGLAGRGSYRRGAPPESRVEAFPTLSGTRGASRPSLRLFEVGGAR